MENSYEFYLKQSGHMTLEEMEDIHAQIIEECGRDQDAEELYKDMLEAAIKYATIRAQWNIYSPMKQAEEDPHRTRIHDGLIAHVNALARYLRMQGRPGRWRQMLGDDRRRIRDFGCYLAFLEALTAR